MNKECMEQLYLASEEARIPLTFTFGKNKGRVIAEMVALTQDKNYLKWIVKNIEHDPYLVQACETALKNIGV